jgi:hypothetical membrane protein
MSELGAINAPYANIINIGFSIFGLLLICFSYGLYKIIENNKTISSKISSSLITISGLSFFLIGFFPCDPNCINISTIGIIHSYLSDMAQIPLIISPLFLILIFKKDKKWNNIFYYSIITIILGITFFIIYKSNIFENYIGLLQRISFGIPVLWIEIIAIKTYRSNIYK